MSADVTIDAEGADDLTCDECGESFDHASLKRKHELKQH